MHPPAVESLTGALLPGRWFDGLSSQARPVQVGLQATPRGPALVLHPLSPADAAPSVLGFAEVGWPEVWDERRPPQCVVVDLRERGSLEIDAVSQWRAALAACGQRPDIVQRMQTRWRWLLGVAAVVAIGLALFYRYGTPWAATQITRFVPLAWEQRVAENVLQQLDHDLLKASKLPQERQAQLRSRFDALVQHSLSGPQRYPGYRPQLALEFRSGLGANAFALPGGKVLMTDDMVRVAATHGLDDNALLGVLAHEIGHAVQRHTTRMLVQQGVLYMGMELALGDVSGVLSTSASLLTGLAYSRSHEREADCYAIALMGQAALPTRPMAQLLLAIAQDDDDDDEEDEDPVSTGASPPSGAHKTKRRAGQESAAHPVWSLLNSHPDIVQRATELERGQAPHCPGD
ncbi:peptidase M48 [Verminephrobacter aporrectodeae subsp. tuberculatae]|uniref:M48 family metallopeptidase n=1 Tax=Verminephrobacter aporrectodeae TaxID=1110389 RepID=UPI002242FBC6|nr:M48 family metallopeptidase [Verminephrobacter aporrectodeae]MCW8199614.1 peptidase M48 [Verminephrobacter aporrectodeae subsp. tuberculatae]